MNGDYGTKPDVVDEKLNQRYSPLTATSGLPLTSSTSSSSTGISASVVLASPTNDGGDSIKKGRRGGSPRPLTRKHGHFPSETSTRRMSPDGTGVADIRTGVDVDAELPMTDIDEPNAYDVLCGKGGGIMKHPGNKSFRYQVQLAKQQYASSNNEEKNRMTQEIVDMIRSQKRRFLDRDSTGKWFDIGNKRAYEKTMRALRDHKTKEKQSATSSRRPLPSSAADENSTTRPAGQGRTRTRDMAANGDGRDENTNPAPHLPPMYSNSVVRTAAMPPTTAMSMSSMSSKSSSRSRSTNASTGFSLRSYRLSLSSNSSSGHRTIRSSNTAGSAKSTALESRGSSGKQSMAWTTLSEMSPVGEDGKVIHDIERINAAATDNNNNNNSNASIPTEIGMDTREERQQQRRGVQQPPRRQQQRQEIRRGRRRQSSEQETSNIPVRGRTATKTQFVPPPSFPNKPEPILP